jgi:putative tricarboxylic transport membrane protein
MLRVVASQISRVALIVSAVAAPVAAQPAYQHLRIIAPAAPGGGWDQTARVMQQVLQRAGIVHTSSVENIPGAAGTIGLARFIGAERGNGDVVMVSGLIMLGAIVTHASPVTLREVTPIARLTGEYEVIVVPASSPFRSLHDLVRAFRERPESISWGGGSAGGTDQMLAGLVADAVGVSPRRVNYIAFSGGGESMSAILGGQVSAGINGLAEFAPHIEAGTVRVLGISSAERLPGIPAPTLREQGLDVELENWRSLVAPPGISPVDRERLERAVETMVRSSEWRQELERYRWIDRYLAGDEFTRFAHAEDQRVHAILTKLGLGPGETSPRTAGVYPLLVLAGLAFWVAAAVLETARAHLSSPRSSDVGRWTITDRRWTIDDGRWRSAALIAAGMALDLALIEQAGFVPASAVLFWLTARAFDRHHPGRDALYALAVSASAYLLFVRVLNVTLPAGVIGRWF